MAKQIEEMATSSDGHAVLPDAENIMACLSRWHLVTCGGKGEVKRQETEEELCSESSRFGMARAPANESTPLGRRLYERFSTPYHTPPS